MPLNGHSYLVAQGWSGQGKGLREGSISRPLAIPQKRTLAGLGKDRDEAFPFWDHLFNAAAKSIQVKVFNDDDDSNTDNDGPSSLLPGLHRTSTGLISNRRPNVSTASSSGAATPDISAQTEGFRLSLLATAKREAAKRGLYARFFRGPVLGPDTKDVEVEVQVSAIASASIVAQATSSTTDKEDGRPEKVERKKDKTREETGVKENSKGEKRRAEKEKKRRDKSKEKGKGKEKATEDPVVEDIRSGEIEDVGKKKRTKRKDRGEKSSEGDDSVEGLDKDERKRKRRREKDGDTDGPLAESHEVPSKDKKRRARILEGNEMEKDMERRKEKEDRKRRKEEKRKRRESKSG